MVISGKLTTDVKSGNRGEWFVWVYSNGKLAFKKKAKDHVTASHFASMIKHCTRVHVAGKRITLDYE